MTRNAVEPWRPVVMLPRKAACELLPRLEVMEEDAFVCMPVSKKAVLELLRLSEKTGESWDVLGREALKSGLPVVELFSV